MALVAAKCPNCGGELEVDPKQDAGICKYCGTPFITQKAIVNYNTSIINNTYINADKVELTAPKIKKRKVHIYNLNFDSFFSSDLKLELREWPTVEDCTLFVDDQIVETNQKTHTLTIEVDANAQHRLCEKRLIRIDQRNSDFVKMATRNVEKNSPSVVIPEGEDDIWIVYDGKVIKTEKEFQDYIDQKKKFDEYIQAKIKSDEKATKKKMRIIALVSAIIGFVGLILVIVGLSTKSIGLSGAGGGIFSTGLIVAFSSYYASRQ